ncbi:MAG: hypothetical protein V4594_11325 [Bacteroidota bacterium]
MSNKRANSKQIYLSQNIDNQYNELVGGMAIGAKTGWIMRMN